MKKAFIIVGVSLVSIIGIAIIILLVKSWTLSNRIENAYAKLGKEAPLLTVDGRQFKDLNKNGKLDVYEDSRESIEARVNDLVSQMTLEEKAGSMFINLIPMSQSGAPLDKPILWSSNPIDRFLPLGMPPFEMLIDEKMNSFNIVHSYDANIMARFSNQLQKIGEKSRLGIPITIASDPRHTSEDNHGVSIYTPAFSQWPSFLGLAATRDTVLVKEFANMARQEYLASGIRLALHPMADLATEPRWGRSSGTFGEDAHLSAMMTKAYVLGFQGDTLGRASVACMTKHFSGGGPQERGEDAHFEYGKNQVYPGNNFDYHLIPFEKGAFPAHTAQIMPYYGIPVDQTGENVGFSFDKTIITKILREKYKFDGVVCTDWAIINDNMVMDARAWGLEGLTPIERVQKVIEAGCDQFGGERSPELIIELVKEGQITEERINVSVKRIMRDKFTLGLFDDPYVDEEKSNAIAGNSQFREAGKIAQAQSMVLLKNSGLLPLKKGTKIFASGMRRSEVLSQNGELVYSPEEADVILIRINAPFEPRNDFFLEEYFHQGRLYYSEEEKAEILTLIRNKPSIVVVNLDRPAILTEIDLESQALLAEFGTTDEVLSMVLFGHASPEGKLPFELPSSWEAVENQLEDMPYDSKDPLYNFGHGLSYE